MPMPKPLLCVTVTAGSTAELRARRDAVAGADVVELRLDTVRDPDVAGALAGRRQPVLVTCRPRHEGGDFAGSGEERRRLLGQAIELGAEYVDIEAGAGFDDLVRRRGGRGIVLSLHDWQGVPADLDARVRSMQGTGAEILKLAVTARALSDCLPLVTLGRGAAPGQKRVLIAMGEAGLPTRVLTARFGSCWAYAGDVATAGQLPASRLLDEFNWRRLGACTRVFGIVGRPVSHSLSPAMHNAFFREAGLDAVFLPLAAADVDDFLRFAAALDMEGASVTAPFKTAMVAALDAADALSRQVGAVNTVRWRAGAAQGTNTDVAGFLAPLRGRLALRGCRTAILGAGGAARAVALALGSEGARVTVYGRTRAHREAVAALAGGVACDGVPAAGSWDLLVNATPVGMRDASATPFPDGPFTGRIVYDLVYTPPVTRLLADAAVAGVETIGGLEMLVAQAERQAEFWTGARPPAGLLRATALAALSARGDA